MLLKFQEKPTIRAGWKSEPLMFQRLAFPTALLLIFSSCEKKEVTADYLKSQATHSNKRLDRQIDKVSESGDDLKTAFEMAKQMEPGLARDNAIAEIAGKAISSDPDIAADAILELPVGNEAKMALIDAYLQELIGAENSTKALVWVELLGDKEEAARGRERIAYLLAEAHPERLPATSFTATESDPAAVEALQKWSAEEPNEAIAWAAKLPEGEARVGGVKIVLSQWLGNDAASALSWVDSQRNTQFRNETVSAMSQVLSRDLMRNVILEEAPPKLRKELEQGIAEIALQKEAEESVPEEESPPELEKEPDTSE